MEEEEYFGTVGGLRELRKYFNYDTFLLTNCDVLAILNYSSLLNWHNKREAKITILVAQKKTNIPYGVVTVENDYVTDISEKPFYNHLISCLFHRRHIVSSICMNKSLTKHFWIRRHMHFFKIFVPY